MWSIMQKLCLIRIRLENSKKLAKLAFDEITAENANEVADEAMGEIYELLLERHRKQLQSIR
jgi:type I restriction-modification system DNA methylase subunit